MIATLRSLLLAMPLALVLAGAAGAQETSTSGAATAAEQAAADVDPSHQLARLTQRLQLSPEQAAQIGPILQDRLRETRALCSDNSLSDADRHAKIRAIVQSHDSQIAAILSDSQRQQFTKMRQQRMQRRMQAQPTDGD
jgi:protein CpxP